MLAHKLKRIDALPIWQKLKASHCCRWSPVLLRGDRKVNINSCPKRYTSIMNYSVFHVLCFYVLCHKSTQALFWKSSGWAGLQAPREKKEKRRCNRRRQALLTYSSFEIRWCALYQPTQGSSQLDGKHFYWAFWEGQMPPCVYVHFLARL